MLPFVHEVTHLPLWEFGGFPVTCHTRTMELIHYLGNHSLGSPKVDEFSDQFTVRAGALFIPTAL